MKCLVKKIQFSTVVTSMLSSTTQDAMTPICLVIKNIVLPLGVWWTPNTIVLGHVSGFKKSNIIFKKNK